MLLPSMGYCDVHEASLEQRITFHNENRFICEISPHILYQYVFMVLWFFFLSSIIISFFGLIGFILNTVLYLLPCGKNSSEKTILKYLTLREIEYLEIIKKSSMVKYGDLLTRLKQQRFNKHGKMDDDYELSNDLDKYISSFTL